MSNGRGAAGPLVERVVLPAGSARVVRSMVVCGMLGCDPRGAQQARRFANAQLGAEVADETEALGAASARAAGVGAASSAAHVAAAARGRICCSSTPLSSGAQSRKACRVDAVDVRKRASAGRPDRR